MMPEVELSDTQEEIEHIEKMKEEISSYLDCGQEAVEEEKEGEKSQVVNQDSCFAGTGGLKRTYTMLHGEEESDESDLDEDVIRVKKGDPPIYYEEIGPEKKKSKASMKYQVDGEAMEYLCKLGKAYDALFDCCCASEMELPQECFDFQGDFVGYESVAAKVSTMFTVADDCIDLTGSSDDEEEA